MTQHCRGQTYDITGIAGEVYSLIADKNLYLNARFAEAFTTGFYIDPETSSFSNLHSHGTWMSEIGAVINGFQVVISVEPSEEIEECQMKPADCLRFGSVNINGAEDVYFIGKVKASQDVELTLSNKKSFSVMSIKSEHLVMEVDVVPPPQVEY